MSSSNGKAPDKLGTTGRDAKGRVLPGHALNPAGRPKGIDFRALVREHRGADLEADMAKVYQMLFARACDGDVQAAKLLLDKLCTGDESTLNVNHTGALNGAPVISFAEWLEHLRGQASERDRRD